MRTRSLIALLAASQLWAQAPKPAELSKATLVGPNDTITITALNADEISKSWRISSSGDLNLPLAGRIHAAGLTVEQLEQGISERLRKYIVDPQVTVYVSQTLSQPVTVSGAVEKPSVVQLSGPTSLFAVLVEAGGTKLTAGSVKVTRKIENGPISHPLAHLSTDEQFSTLEVPLQSVMNGDQEDSRVQVIPGDVVSVSPVKRVRTVYITGEVTRPGAIELATTDTVNLTKVLALAGGLTHTAKPGRTMIRHIEEDGTETALAFVDINKIMNGKAKDLTLSDGDVIVIPSNEILTYLQTASQAAISSSMMILARL